MKKISAAVVWVMGTALVLLLFYNIYMHFDNKDKTQLAVMGEIENKLEVTGYIVRDESILVPDNGQVISSVKTNGERVSVGELVATVYETDVDYETRAKLSDINQQIEKLEELKEKSSSGDSAGKFETKIKTYVGNLIVKTHKSGGGGLYEAKLQLEDAFSAKLASKSEDVNSAIAQLKEEKSAIEQGVTGEKKNIYSNKAGVFLTTFDGYEGIFDFSAIKEITPSKIKEAQSVVAKPSSGNAVKIADNFEWYFVAIADSKKLNAEKPGNKVYLRTEQDSDHQIEMTIESISPEEKGKCAIVLKGTSYEKQLFLKNKYKAEIIIDSSRGLKVSKDAIKVVDGVKGVYIIKKGTYAFREVNILASNDEYVVIERNLSTDKPHLALYDEVIVHGYSGE